MPNGYVARLSPLLNTLVFGTYFPGGSRQQPRLHSDGSVYYGGIRKGAFPRPRRPCNRRRRRIGPEAGRNQESCVGTYIGGPDIWLSRPLRRTAAMGQCFALPILPHVDDTLIASTPFNWESDTDGSRSKPMISRSRMGTSSPLPEGTSHLARNPLLDTACPARATGPTCKLEPGRQAALRHSLAARRPSKFEGTSDQGLPIIRTNYGRFEIIEADSSMGVFAGCLLKRRPWTLPFPPARS